MCIWGSTATHKKNVTLKKKKKKEVILITTEKNVSNKFRNGFFKASLITCLSVVKQMEIKFQPQAPL